MALIAIGCEDGRWMELAEDCVQCWALVFAMLNCCVLLPHSYFGFHKFQYILNVQNTVGDSKNINQNRTTFAPYLKVKDEMKNRFDNFTMVRIHIVVFCIMTSTLVGRNQPSGWTHCLLLQDMLEAAHSSDERPILMYGTVVQLMDFKPQKVCEIWLEILFHPTFWELFSLCYVTILSLSCSLSLSSTDHHFAVHIVPKTQQTVKLQDAVKPSTVTKIWQCRYSSNIVLSLL